MVVFSLRMAAAAFLSSGTVQPLRPSSATKTWQSKRLVSSRSVLTRASPHANAGKASAKSSTPFGRLDSVFGRRRRSVLGLETRSSSSRHVFNAAVEGSIAVEEASAAPVNVSEGEENIAESGTTAVAPPKAERFKPRIPGQKARREDPTVPGEALVEGAVFTGKVTTIQPFGAFVNFGAFTDGLVHISKMSTGYVSNVSDIVSLGQEVKVSILNVEQKSGRIALSMVHEEKEAQEGTADTRFSQTPDGRPVNRGRIAGSGRQNRRDEPQKPPTKLVKGQEVEGNVKNKIRSGIFVELPENEEGFLRYSDIPGGENMAPEFSLQVGEKIKPTVMRIERGRILLTMKPVVDISSVNRDINKGQDSGATNPFEIAFRAFRIVPDAGTVEKEAAEEEIAPPEGVITDVAAAAKEFPDAGQVVASEGVAAVVEEAAPGELEVLPEVSPFAEDVVIEATSSVKDAETSAVEESAGAVEGKLTPGAVSTVDGTLAEEQVSSAKEEVVLVPVPEVAAVVEGSPTAIEEIPTAEEKLIPEATVVVGDSPTAVEEIPPAEEKLIPEAAVVVGDSPPAVEEIPPAEENLKPEAAVVVEDSRTAVEEIPPAEEKLKPEAAVVVEDSPTAVEEIPPAEEKLIPEAAVVVEDSPPAVEEIPPAEEKLIPEAAVVVEDSPPAVEEIPPAEEKLIPEAAVVVEDSPTPVEEIPPAEEKLIPEAAAVVVEAAVAGEVIPETQAAPTAKESAVEKSTVGIPPALVKQLRDETGAGMMDCKRALTEASGDIEKARETLRKKGLASADKKANRIASEGLVGSYVHDSRIGVLVEVNCETDFVSRGPAFKSLVEDLGMQVAASQQVQFVSVEDIPAEIVNREKVMEAEREDLANKPEAIRARIVEGRASKKLNEIALLEQPYIRDDKIFVKDLVKQTIATLGENIKVRRFERYVLGEGLQKKGTDLAAEVAAQTGVNAPIESEKPKEAPASASENVVVSPACVKELRERTGAGIMDCKKALASTDNDLDKAVEFLHKKGLASANKKAGRLASEGLVGTYIHDGRIGVLVEVNCETDFVARGEKFKELVEDLAMQIAAYPQVQVVSVDDVPAEMVAKEKELESGKEDLASKPEAIRARIVDGRVAKRLAELALLEQPFIKDDKKLVKDILKETIASLDENIQIRRFARFNLGEGIEKKVVDFASEVAAQSSKKG